MDHVDRVWAAISNSKWISNSPGTSWGKRDLKLHLSTNELVALVGHDSVAQLANIMQGYNKIIVRRVEEHGRIIKFHTDTNPFTNRTLQVPLNEQGTREGEYVGGQLVYVTSEGLQTPRRRAGSGTVHDDRVVHGVTKLARGVRYSLYLLLCVDVYNC